MLGALLLTALSGHDALAITTAGDVYELTFDDALATFIGSTGYDDPRGLARDRSGVLWTLVDGPGSDRKLVMVDPATGAGTAVTTLALGGTPGGMSFDIDGSLLVIVHPAAGGNARLVRVDMSSYAITQIGDTNEQELEGLVVAPEGRSTPGMSVRAA
jgi:hypothetical protein